tara:strand:- start:694 stop:1122 length:429 start_codon:yes stop_codon:yes gene_type:complete
MSTLVVDTLTGKSTATTLTIGSTPVVSASANSLTIRGEGSAQTSVQQGLAKAWFRANSSASVLDSLNISSGTDNGTGDYSYAISNAFASANFSANYTAYVSVSRIATRNSGRDGTSALATEIFDGSSASDHSHNGTAHGDLA